MSPEDVRMLVADLEKLHHQVDTLQGDVKSYRDIAALLFMILTFIGLGTILSFWKRIGKRVNKEAARHAAKAATLFDRIESEWRITRATLESSYIIRAGSQPLTFPNFNYVNYWVNFDAPFPGVPVVLLTEQVAGEWCYAKVDEVEVGRFKIALRTLSGVPINQTRNIQWLAICPKPAIAPVGGVPIPAG